MFESLLFYAFENPPVPENIPKPPREGIGISCRWGGSVRPQNVKKCLKCKWNHQREVTEWGRGSLRENTFCVGSMDMGSLDIFWNCTLSKHTG